MLTIIHGENLVKSREKLWQLKQQAQGLGQKIDTYLAKKISPKNLEDALSQQDLFGQGHCLVIEELHSLPHSKQRTGYIDNLVSASQNLDIILWEKKLLSTSNLKKFPQARIFDFKMGKALWEFLDIFSPKSPSKKNQLILLHQAIEEDSAEFVFIMLSKRVRELLATLAGADEKIHPFVKRKLQQQVRLFSLPQLLKIHQELYHLDQLSKQSLNLLDLGAELDLCLINL